MGQKIFLLRRAFVIAGKISVKIGPAPRKPPPRHSKFLDTPLIPYDFESELTENENRSYEYSIIVITSFIKYLCTEDAVT